MSCSTIWTLVETVDQISTLADKLAGLDSTVPYLYVDIEGNNIGSGGAMSLMQVLLFKEKHVYLIDVRLLKEQAFDTVGSTGISLRSILESPDVAKAFFDVRTDALALHRAYGIKLAGVQDIQLMDIGARSRAPRFLGSLAKCIEYSKDISLAQRQICSAAKAAGHKLFAPEAGGSYAIFDVRPLPHAISKYCVQDVLLLPTLWNEYQCRLGPDIFNELLREACRRIAMVEEPGFTREGRKMAHLPNNWSSFPRNPAKTWVDRTAQDFKSDCRAIRSQISVLAYEESIPTTECKVEITVCSRAQVRVHSDMSSDGYVDRSVKVDNTKDNGLNH